MKSNIKSLLAEYCKRKSEIRRRLKEFSAVHKEGDDRVFEELCFCLMTANANALKCDEAIRDLRSSGLIRKGSFSQIWPKLRGRVRFHNNKARYICGARDLFTDGGRIKVALDLKDVISARDWLVDNVKGLGYKEASHFLRNIGFGNDIAILDRHILKNLKRYGVINEIPDSVGSRKIYTAIEDKMRKFSKDIKIPLPDLDLLFWSIQTGFVFK